MTKIRCKYLDCELLDERYCSAAAIELSPDHGCLTYRPAEDPVTLGNWEEEIEEWEEDDDSESLWEVEEEEDELDDDDEM